ncbi:L-seryl-tRNA(Sec) selenium transferase [Bacillus marinisedimentorum]|uniref:L-seryl-tRNA(Sec) selenium transferase n=1 Tax=Bacillus marinisedimentorum TaxID=1821260 RepID=UPI0007E140B2|nr:L-seryl-tRNA(Sec) selenium transferase [Bacillus marinisedimentorum]
MKQHLRHIPPVHKLQQDERFTELLQGNGLSTDKLTGAVQFGIEQLRRRLLDGSWEGALTEAAFTAYIFAQTAKKTTEMTEYKLKKVINAAGTIIHTNLGRSRLSNEAIRKVTEAAENYSNLEYRLEEGKRGSRHTLIEEWLVEATGAEAAMVVNNNAAAVYLVLRAMAENREVIVSRGQLVEIGGSFRVSSIMEESGAKLVEVGTTNKTHLHDYEHAVTEETAMIMKVHTSNFKTIGFTKTVSTSEMASIKKENEGLIFYEDLGSGALYDYRKYGIGNEPTVREVLDAGADIVSFSGDKLLGGPQAGIIAGKKELIDQLKRHQLARVLRVDKMTLAALEATLKAYVLGSKEILEIPTVRDILKPIEDIRQTAEAFKRAIETGGSAYNVRLISDISQVGGGTMPDVELPTAAAAVTHPKMNASRLLESLRNHSPAIIARARDEKVILDFRTLSREDTAVVVAALQTLERHDA